MYSHVHVHYTMSHYILDMIRIPMNLKIRTPVCTEIYIKYSSYSQRIHIIYMNACSDHQLQHLNNSLYSATYR